MRYYIYIVFLTAILTAACVTSKSIEPGCKTPDKKVGECKLSTKCETIPFLRDVRRTKQQTNYLRESICGYQHLLPMICCPFASSVLPVTKPTVETVATTLVVHSTSTAPSGIPGDCSASSLPPNPDSKCCGIHGLSLKIQGGTETGIDQYPWLVLLEYRDIDDVSLIDTKCGGSLISGRYVLTAAQCVDAARTNIPESVRLGEYDTLSNIDCEEEDDDINICNDDGTVSIPIQKIIMHSQFKRGLHPKNDIALLRLTEMATFSDFIRPVCLPTITATAPTNLYVAGWGASNTGPRNSVKMHVMLPFVNLTACNSSYDHQLQQRQICAGGDIGKDACKGDSGGPLMRITGIHYEVLGIVSYGSKHCGYQYPGVYTNVMEYLDWIKINMHE